MRSIEIHQRAEMDLVAACEWYEAQQPGLSKKFRNEVEFKIQLIAANPELYSTKYNNHLRFAPLRKYPYIVVYWHDKSLDSVFITSVFYTKRNPEKFE